MVSAEGTGVNRQLCAPGGGDSVLPFRSMIGLCWLLLALIAGSMCGSSSVAVADAGIPPTPTPSPTSTRTPPGTPPIPGKSEGEPCRTNTDCQSGLQCSFDTETATSVCTLVPTLTPTLLPTPPPSPTGGPIVTLSCIGDCNADHHVTVAEIIMMVNIVLGNLPMSVCPASACDNHPGTAVPCILEAADNAIVGCPPT